MSIFSIPSVYKLLEKSRDFESEVAFLSEVVGHDRFNRIDSVLDLGCGLGSHSQLLIDLGKRVTGVDKFQIPTEVIGNPQFRFVQVDLTNLCMDEEKFDLIVSLFHVMNYLSKECVLGTFFCKVANLMPEHGIFCFDVWNQDCVVHKGLEVTRRYYEFEEDFMERRLTPIGFDDTGRCDLEVRYVGTISGESFNLSEKHFVNSYTYQEIQTAVSRAGLKIESCVETGSCKPLSPEVFSAFYLITKNAP